MCSQTLDIIVFVQASWPQNKDSKTAWAKCMCSQRLDILICCTSQLNKVGRQKRLERSTCVHRGSMFICAQASWPQTKESTTFWATCMCSQRFDILRFVQASWSTSKKSNTTSAKCYLCLSQLTKQKKSNTTWAKYMWSQRLDIIIIFV